MDEAGFRQQLGQDGFAEPSVVMWEPNAVNPDHTHDFTARGLILSGGFVMGCSDGEQAFNQGDVFEHAAGTPHEETTGPDGCRFLVGRK
ncbi:MAG: cupin domain-containing protein [Alphaproteobacteria bacterium]|jgi:quercetin dioxygenase-like cupin family protein|tara:strand:+ start:341 stop:607 length:267 start_codon:yes stop_codon:yes gene_type:complete